jgi:hypothetical protein
MTTQTAGINATLAAALAILISACSIADLGERNPLVFAIDNFNFLLDSGAVNDLRNPGIGYSTDPLRESTSTDK